MRFDFEFQIIFEPGVPGGLVGGPRAYQDQFHGFESRWVHARRDLFLHEID